MNNQVIWLDKPASAWEEAFPIGNGSMGAMIFGGTDIEKIDFNVDTLWSGTGKQKLRMDSSDVFYKAQKEAIKGNYIKAEHILQNNFLNDWNESFLPLGSLYIQLGTTGKELRDYKRILDLATGVCKVSYAAEHTHIVREAYCSFPDKITVVKIQCSGKPLDANLYLESLMPFYRENQNPYFFISGNAPSKVYPNYYECDNPIQYSDDSPGMAYCLAFGIKTDGMLEELEGEKLCVRRFTGLTLYISAEAGYDVLSNAPITDKKYVINICKERIDTCFKRGEKRIYKKHKKDFSDLFSRVDFSLNCTIIADEPLDKRLKKIQNGGNDNSLFALWFQLGRYLLISSSREGCLPAHLQGLWNASMRPPWSSNYTTNINVQMNYWIAEVANLGDCHKSLLSFIKACAAVGAKTAEEQFGCRGWTANHNIDLWKQTSPVGDLAKRAPLKYAYFPAASGWLCRHIWEHYLFSQDILFLQEYYPVMREAALFYIDYLTEKDGFYISAPSVSPENSFIDSEGSVCAVSIGSTSDTAIIRTLFHDCIKAAGILGCDAELSQTMESIASKMPPYRISASGTLMEWFYDFKEADPEHRHLSHLYGLYPSDDLCTLHNADLLNACRKTLKRRTDEGPGWSKAWKACLYARLKDGEKALSLLKNLLTPVSASAVSYVGGGSYINLLCAHPPFQIDGNFGAAAAIAEMLIQSHTEYIELLPALPAEWKRGRVKGLCARGGYIFDFEWNECSITKLRIYSKNKKKCKVFFNNTCKDCKCRALPQRYTRYL